MMNPLLISNFGTSVYVNKRKLIIQNKLANQKLEFHPHQIDHDSIIVDGHTGNITFEAMRWLMKHDINLTLLNWNGNLLGITLPQAPKSGKLRVKQYTKHMDSQARYKIALAIVEQKITHTLNLLKELSRYYSEVDIKSARQLFAEENHNYTLIHSGRNKVSMNGLMMYEGRVATYYWEVLAKIFNELNPEFHFRSRKNKSYSWNMNASDEVNALLNYGYAILESEIRTAINSVGLDPAVGFLHELAISKTPLVYDMQELFRWLVDISVIQLLEEKKLKKSDFITTENYHTRLRESAGKALIEKISLNFNRRVSYKGKNFSYQTILQYNVQHLANFILDKNKNLIFEIPPIKIERNDVLSMKQKILALSPSERKKLGINKSTLWYQQKNLAAGKRIKIYNKVMAKLQ
jgi:CRISPR-associated protein Cas1